MGHGCQASGQKFFDYSRQDLEVPSLSRGRLGWGWVSNAAPVAIETHPHPSQEDCACKRNPLRRRIACDPNSLLRPLEREGAFKVLPGVVKSFFPLCLKLSSESIFAAGQAKRNLCHPLICLVRHQIGRPEYARNQAESDCRRNSMIEHRLFHRFGNQDKAETYRITQNASSDSLGCRMRVMNGNRKAHHCCQQHSKQYTGYADNWRSIFQHQEKRQWHHCSCAHRMTAKPMEIKHTDFHPPPDERNLRCRDNGKPDSKQHAP